MMDEFGIGVSFGAFIGVIAGIFLMYSCSGFSPALMQQAEKLCESHGGLVRVEADEIHCKQLRFDWPEKEQ